MRTGQTDLRRAGDVIKTPFPFGASGEGAGEEGADVLGDGVEVALQGEVPRLQQMDLGVGQILAECRGAVGAEDLVACAPDRQQRVLGVAVRVLWRRRRRRPRRV